MERMDRRERDETQKAKLIFLSLVVLVAVLLIWSFVAASKARSERNAAQQELDAVKQDNAKLEQMLKEVTRENETLESKVRHLEAVKTAKRTAKKSKSAKHSSRKSKKKSSKTKKHR